jgi:hypothetical protein
MRQVLCAGLGLVVLLATGGLLRAGGNEAEIKQVLDRAVKAAGGRDKFAKLQAVTWKGKADFTVGNEQISLTHEGSAEGWDKYRVELQAQVNGNNAMILVVLNGKKAWAGEGGRVKEAKDEEIGFVRDFFYAWRLPQMLPAVQKDKAFKVSHLGELKVGDRDAVGLLFRQKGRPDLSVFFDKKGGLPVKSVVRLKTPDKQEKELEFLFGDYKDFDGVRHFTKMTVRVDGQEYVTEVSELRAPGELDAGLFAKPE